MTVQGYVDGLVGAYLSGWAVDPDDPAPCQIEIRDPGGAVRAQGPAARPRSDLAGQTQGRIRCGFRLPVPGLGVPAGELLVFANGVALAGPPLTTGPGWFDGVVTVQDGHAEGWVHERLAGYAPPRISLTDQDGVVVAQGPAVLAASADPYFAPARFHLKLDQSAFGSPELRLLAEADGVAFAHTEIVLTLDGFLDELTERRCSGWLLSRQAPWLQCELEVLCDGVLVGSGRCALPRDDLRAEHAQAWQSGFEIALTPAIDRTPRLRHWVVRLAGTTRPLFGGPQLLGPRIARVSAARRAAGLAHDAATLDAGARAVLQAALAAYIAEQRDDEVTPAPLIPLPPEPPSASRRFSVVIPIYRDLALTRACIDSVLIHRDPATDALVLIDDCSPEPGMAALLAGYATLPQVWVLTNPHNRGFVSSVNRALGFCRAGDVILLNSDTVVFPGGLAELWRAAQSAPEIGTATPLSNNATIFSYPEPNVPCADLADIGWAELAAVALSRNAGQVYDVPTGHGFCLLLRRRLLDRLGRFDEAYGRGYGEENDFCLAALDLGYRHVAAAGAFVAHRENVSFGAEKAFLLAANLALLERRYPEYAGDVRAFLAADGLRQARWALDRARLAAAPGGHVLVIRNWLDGGTARAAAALERHPGFGAAGSPLHLLCGADGMLRLSSPALQLSACFAAEEGDALLALLADLAIVRVVIHQLLGFGQRFIARLLEWLPGRSSAFYLHDFYPLCPRVTMIDAAGQFCDVAPTDVCARCVALGGAHEASRLDALSPAEHRALLGGVLTATTEVIAPSASAASYLRRAFPEVACRVVPHPEPAEAYRRPAGRGDAANIVLLGAIGPHKGSGLLRELAGLARLAQPTLHFHVIGYTDCDRDLRAIGNVQITGPYEPDELAGLAGAANGRVALFLNRWPETFSYTLSEAVQLGLAPLVPDLGAPAERVRAAGFGHVYPHPIDLSALLALLAEIAAGRVDLDPLGLGPAGFAPRATLAPPGRTRPPRRTAPV